VKQRQDDYMRLIAVRFFFLLAKFYAD